MLTWVKFIIKIACLNVISFYVWAEIMIVPLYNRTTDEILPVVQQSFPDVPMNSYGGQLVVNGATATQNNQIKELISKLDTPARRLIITIDDKTDKRLVNQSYYINLQSDHKRNIEVNYGNNQSIGKNLTSNFKQLLVNEGSPFYILSSQAIPQVSQYYDNYGRLVRDTHYLNVDNGLYIIARVVDQQVYIDIMAQRNSLAGSDTINQQAINSHITGALGEWIQLGNFQQINNNNNHNYGYSAQSSNLITNQLRIKVELDK